MEKFSAYREQASRYSQFLQAHAVANSISSMQPFLTPVPPLGSDLLAKATLPIRYPLAVIRTALVLVLALVYVLLVQGICLVFLPVASLYQLFTHLFTFILARTALFILGFLWISPEQFNRKRGRGVKLAETWNIKAGDIIVSNWASWIEILWLATQYNPTFVIPIVECLPETPAASRTGTPISHKPGRRTGTGSANIQMADRALVTRIPIAGFRQLSLLSMIAYTGGVPELGGPSFALEEIRRSAKGPVVVFPECTTSNGRGLLRFADVFRTYVPAKGYQVFIMSARFDPPTPTSPTLTHPIPSLTINPFSHLFSICTSISPAELSIRLLAPSESPSSPLFVASEILADYAGEDQLSETCANLIAQMGKMKRTGMGWEDKCNFLQFYRGKSS
ncbi:hypothetical protein D9619_000453 [Psilocybe cf. subviscida]|uniref:Phospholipid/glycerol acyltransferase domain-containing protein n=1 Tax=Psilocybe cf. subviscida TaxID=2480587 RepID=A0A8H5BGN2_9AGAR|nr:hypothetical protein D9619_000453 [Psilocybe cf. subviscida]